jgi:hypothetical protein
MKDLCKLCLEESCLEHKVISRYEKQKIDTGDITYQQAKKLFDKAIISQYPIESLSKWKEQTKYFALKLKLDRTKNEEKSEIFKWIA